MASVQRCNFFGGEPIKSNEVDMRVGKLKNRKAAVRTRSLKT